MTLSFQMIAAGIAVFLLGVLGFLALTPSAKSKRGRGHPSDKPKPNVPADKEWQAVSLKLERHIHALRKEIEEYQKKQRSLEADLSIEKQKYAKLQEKLLQERDWQKKEEADVEKKAQEIAALKNNSQKLENDLGSMHLERLRFERELRETKSENDAILQVRRALELQVQKLEAQNEALHKEVKELRWETQRLSEKKDAESWVPKEEFEKLQENLRNKEKDLARLQEQFKIRDK